jgi:hypothetical protein
MGLVVATEPPRSVRELHLSPGVSGEHAATPPKGEMP